MKIVKTNPLGTLAAAARALQRPPLSRRSTSSLLLTSVVALFAALVLLLVAVERTDAQAQGGVWAWGCDCTTTDSTTPVQVSGLSGVQAIDAGAHHSLALKSDGSVWAWGYNSDGELGDGTTTGSTTPVQVSGLSSVQAIDAGASHNLALNTSDAPNDTTAPMVTSTVPASNAKGVDPTINVRAIFSEEMDSSTINGTTFQLFKKGTTTQVAAQVSYNADTDTAKLDPSNNLRRGVAYKAVVSTWAKDVAGNRLDQDSSTSGFQQMRWFFRVDD